MLVLINLKIKFNKYKIHIKQKIQSFLGITTLTKEVHYNFIQLDALDKYIKATNEIDSLIYEQCKKNNITNPDHIKQLINNQKIKNYLEYNKLLIEKMKEIPRKEEGKDLKYVI